MFSVDESETENMDIGRGFCYRVEGYRLYPSAIFYKMLAHQHERARESIEMKRLGLLTRQVYRFEEVLVVDHVSPVSNENIAIFPDRSEKLELPVVVKEREKKIAACALEVRDDISDDIIFNKKDFDTNVVDSVYWLLNKLSGKFTDSRKRAIGQYCIKTGLFATEDVTPSKSDSNGDDNRWSSSDVSIPHVGKL